MKQSIQTMLEKYPINNIQDERNAIKEVIQELILASLSKSGFFKKAVFCGGTALRILYGLDRFSEDLDFSLMEEDLQFDLRPYLHEAKRYMESYGILCEITQKKNSSNIKSAFLKSNTLEQHIYFGANFTESIGKNELIKIKVELDVCPPDKGKWEYKTLLLPEIYEVAIYNKETLFAGKIHSILCRLWDNRIKGRDLYDFIFYVSRNSSINIDFLNNAMIQTGHLDKGNLLTLDQVKIMLKDKFSNINYKLAIEDVRPFIKDIDSLNYWNSNFFISLLDRIK